MKTFFRAVVCAALTLSVSSVLAHETKPKSGKTKMVMCSVMNHEVPRTDAKSTVYKGRTYYFCCAACVTSFKANPAKYAKAAPKPNKSKSGAKAKARKA